MMLRVLTVAVALLSSAFVHAVDISASATLLVLQSNATGRVGVMTVSPLTGATLAVSDLSFAFPFPLLEVASTGMGKSYFLVTYPVGAPNAVLFQLNAQNLSLEETWLQPKGALSFFDLRFSHSQQQLYGISVVSKYGRTLSRIDTTGENVTSTLLVPLPFPYYVNASSYDHQADMYYGLVNCPTAFANCSSIQKLIVANFAAPAAPSHTVYTIEAPQSTVLHFIVHTPQGLYATATDSPSPALGRLKLDDATGTATWVSVGALPTPDSKAPVLFSVPEENLVCSPGVSSLEVLSCYSLTDGSWSTVKLHATIDPSYSFVAAIATDVQTW